MLSGMAAEENDEEKQEDVLALTRTADVPGFPRGDGGEAGEADVGPVPVEMRDGRSGGRTAGEIESERPGQIAGETAEDENGGTLWKEGLVWSVRSAESEIDAAQRQVLAERIRGTAEAGGMEAAGAEAGAEWAARTEAAGSSFVGARRTAEAQAGLEGLYRQTVQGLRSAAPALPPEQAGRTARAQEPGSAASLAVDELDRAVRRDSRRYDGGMSIF